MPARFLLLVVVLAVTQATLLSEEIRAQDRGPPGAGTVSLDFELPSGGGAGIGISRMWTERTKLGLTLQGGYRSSSRDDPVSERRERSNWSVFLAPELRRYLRDEGPVAPFLSSRLRLGFQSSESSDGFSGGASAGVGAEWFPLDGVGISGRTGLSTSYRSLTGNEGQTANDWSVDLFRSSLRIELYF